MNYIFDACALISLLKREAAFDQVTDLLFHATAGEITIYMSIVNLPGEKLIFLCDLCGFFSLFLNSQKDLDRYPGTMVCLQKWREAALPACYAPSKGRLKPGRQQWKKKSSD